MSDKTYPDIKSFAHFIKWSAACSSREIEELDNYLQEKITELVKKFKQIAENATYYGKITTPSASEDEEIKKIELKGKKLSVSEATKELHRLTDALLDEGTTTAHKIELRKQIDALSLGLFNFTKTLESQSTETSKYIQVITNNISDIIIAFQFHDFVNQRLDHMKKVFETLEQHSEAFLKGEESGTDKIPDDMIEGLINKFFLSDVKNNFLNSLDSNRLDNLNVEIEKEEDDIELF